MNGNDFDQGMADARNEEANAWAQTLRQSWAKMVQDGTDPLAASTDLPAVWPLFAGGSQMWGANRGAAILHTAKGGRWLSGDDVEALTGKPPQGDPDIAFSFYGKSEPEARRDAHTGALDLDASGAPQWETADLPMAMASIRPFWSTGRLELPERGLQAVRAQAIPARGQDPQRYSSIMSATAGWVMPYMASLLDLAPERVKSWLQSEFGVGSVVLSTLSKSFTEPRYPEPGDEAAFIIFGEDLSDRGAMLLQVADWLIHFGHQMAHEAARKQAKKDKAPFKESGWVGRDQPLRKHRPALRRMVAAQVGILVDGHIPAMPMDDGYEAFCKLLTGDRERFSIDVKQVLWLASQYVDTVASVCDADLLIGKTAAKFLNLYTGKEPGALEGPSLESWRTRARAS